MYWCLRSQLSREDNFQWHFSYNRNAPSKGAYLSLYLLAFIFSYGAVLVYTCLIQLQLQPLLVQIQLLAFLQHKHVLLCKSTWSFANRTDTLPACLPAPTAFISASLRCIIPFSWRGLDTLHMSCGAETHMSCVTATKQTSARWNLYICFS